MTDLIKHSGQVFTPDYLVRLILDEAGYKGENILRKHCMDNSCGDGAFLCEIARRYIAAYESRHGSLQGVEEELRTYIHGIEIESKAYACCAENLHALFDSYGLRGAVIDLRQADTLRVYDFDEQMHFVVGNPPYVRVHNLEDNFEAVKAYKFATGGMTDLYLVFFEIGFRMLRTGGRLCYITPSSWLGSVAGANLRAYILTHCNLLSVIDLGHFQAFKATTYTLISLFEKGTSLPDFAYYEFCPTTLGKSFVCRIPFRDVYINGYFYLSDPATLNRLRRILTAPTRKYVVVKNGFATLADKVFIADAFPFTRFTIPTIKASTGRWQRAFYPYDESGHPLPKDEVFADPAVANYLDKRKAELLKGAPADSRPGWYLYGRTQALKDVYTDKLSINTTIKDVGSLKLNKVPAGSGLYSGLYILTEVPESLIADLLLCDAFIAYIASLKKYKSGGYYTYNSQDLERYLNYHISQIASREQRNIKPYDKRHVPEYSLSLFLMLSWRKELQGAPPS